MALADRLKIDLPKLKDYLKIDFDDSDALLADLVKAAKDQVSLHLNNDFTEVGADGVLVEKPIPFSLNLAVYQIVGAWHETRSVGVTAKNVGGISYTVGGSKFPLETLALLAPYRKWVGM